MARAVALLLDRPGDRRLLGLHLADPPDDVGDGGCGSAHGRRGVDASGSRPFGYE
jgi:hypothetical protein